MPSKQNCQPQTVVIIQHRLILSHQYQIEQNYTLYHPSEALSS